MNRIAALALVATLACACTTAEWRRDLAIADEASRATCIVANAFLPDEQGIARACSLGPEFIDLIRKLVAEERTAQRIAALRRCGQ